MLAVPSAIMRKICVINRSNKWSLHVVVILLRETIEPRTAKFSLTDMKYRTILLFGAPGAGKGTQGKIIGSIPNFFHCACGDVFRSMRPDSTIGKIFLEYSSR